MGVRAVDVLRRERMEITLSTLTELFLATKQTEGKTQKTIGWYREKLSKFGKFIGDFQAVQFQLAQAATELEAGRLMVYNAARLRDTKQPYVKEAAMAKLYTAQMAERVTSLCVDLFGGYGFTKEYPVEKYYRDAKIGAIYEGTSNMQLQTIAKMFLTES